MPGPSPAPEARHPSGFDGAGPRPAEDHGPDLTLVRRVAERLFDAALVVVARPAQPPIVVSSRWDAARVDAAVAWVLEAHAGAGDATVMVPDLDGGGGHDGRSLPAPPHGVRFHAGAPLVTSGGEQLGVLAIMDERPRTSTLGGGPRALEDLALLVVDRLEVRRREQDRLSSTARFEHIAATSPDPIMCADARGLVTFWNRAAAELFGYSDEEMLGRPVLTIIPESGREQYAQDFGRLFAAGDVVGADQRMTAEGQHRNGTIIPVELSLSAWPDGDSVAMGAIIRDLTERRETEARLSRLASLDSLTGLLNRGSLRGVLHRAVHEGTPISFAMMDLDGFKDVNDTLGHVSGDMVLTAAADRLRQAAGDALAIGRLGGDEFVVLAEGTDHDGAMALGEAIVAGVSGTYVAGDREVQIGASVGVARFPHDGATAEELIGSADLALYRAKVSGQSTVEHFDASLREEATRTRQLREELRTAHGDGQFELYYQPQFAADGETLVGAEALLRWNHPVRGTLGPAEFIDVLSAKPSAPEVGEWIIRTACEQAVQWRTRVPHLRMGVNLFGVQIKGRSLAPRVARILEETGLPGDALELELVETILTRDDEATLTLLTEVRDMGVHLAFDDYGTGFASLSLLKRYPVSRLKIDRTFVRRVEVDDENAAVVRAVTYLATMFGLGVVAEGIETPQEMEYLRHLGCGVFQGFHLGHPVPVAEFEERFLPT